MMRAITVNLEIKFQRIFEICKIQVSFSVTEVCYLIFGIQMLWVPYIWQKQSLRMSMPLNKSFFFSFTFLRCMLNHF